MKPAFFESSVTKESYSSLAISNISPDSSSASSATIGGSPQAVHNLLDQLQTSHETRFHACWMFLRYFYLSSESFRFPKHVSLFDTNYSTELEREGRELFTLDVSVACLSLSVKFHRDFLDPLLPVYAHEYLALSPHRMSYDDLEVVYALISFGLSYLSD